MNNIKTALLMALMTGLLMTVGQVIGGHNGMLVMLAVSCISNFIAYWNSDKLVLKAYNAIQISMNDNPNLYLMVEKLAAKANIPMPKVYIINSSTPNAFATGRNPSHAAVAVTTGILEMLTDDEIEGVLGHELTHVIHRDTLISTIAASLAGVVAYIAHIAQWIAIFGRNDRENNNPIALIATIIIAPIAASMIQMSISRSREYLADQGGAKLSGKPLSLASALAKIDYYARHGTMPNASTTSAHMFIINPLSGKNINFGALFSTHPSTESRIKKLKELAQREY